MLEYSSENKLLARKLRSEMTPWERKLWYMFLSGYPVRFLRQKLIGHYIVDFYCSRAKLVIEIDGSGHFSEEQKVYDTVRTKFLNGKGLEVLRFTNYEVDTNFYGVCSVIDECVKRKNPQSPTEKLNGDSPFTKGPRKGKL